MERLENKTATFRSELCAAIFIERGKIRIIQDDMPVGWQIQPGQ